MISQIKTEVSGAWAATCAITQSHLRFGHNIYQSDWDLLVVLDSCRVDALTAVSKEYDFISDVGSIWSVGSTSKEWLENTFVEKYADDIADTAFVTANTFSGVFRPETEGDDRLGYILGSESRITDSEWLQSLVKDDLVQASDFYHFDGLGNKLVDSFEHGELHAKTVTDRAIQISREKDPEKLIAHYMQPHQPYIYPDELDELHKHPFRYVDTDQGRQQVWKAYLENLRFALDHVEDLLSNIDAEKVVLTADHGELFGKYLHSHVVGVPHPNLRKVPWATTTASDNETIQPDEMELRTANEEELEQRLSDLGYM